MKALNFNQTQTAVALCMKKLILIAALSMGVSITYGQEYKVVCKRLSGCPVINGTCPTCKIVGLNKTQKELDEEITRMIQELKDNYKKKYQPDLSKRYTKPSGWGVIRWEINEAIRVRKDFDF